MRRILFILILPTLSFAQIDSTDIIISNMMHQQKVVGLSLAIVKNGIPIVTRGYGLANVELNVPVNPETVIRLGSVSKQFFTTAILKLEEEGKLSTDDSIVKYFTDGPDEWKPIKIKHLMTHTAGLRREGPAFENFKIQDDLAIIKSAYELPLEFSPGEKYQYSNLGYFMLAQIITQVSDLSWQDYIEKYLFAVAGMYDTHVTDFYLVIPNRASGYMHRQDSLINAYPMYAIRPSGAFLSTTTDMIKWDKILRDRNMILKKENWERLWQPFVRINDQPESKAFYGFGWGIDEYKGHHLVVHGGSNPGFKSVYARFTDDDLSIIILTNTSEANPHAIAFALADYYFRR